MNDLIERFLALPPRQRIFAVVGAVAAVFLGYYQLLFSPRNADIAKREKELAALRQERQEKQKLADDLPAARQRVADLEAELKKAKARLPDQREIPQLLSTISAVARESGLEVVQFRPAPEEYFDFYAEVPVAMKVKGSFYQVHAFFTRVSALLRIVNIGGISIATPVLAPPDPVRLDINCRTTTFRFLDEAERERIAKQRKQKDGKK